MSNLNIEGHVHSIQTLGTLDGPGVRFVVFLQGCNLRCGCCHNPDTWEMSGGTNYTADEILKKAENFRVYFGKEGGITLSGGEPLLQSEFAKELFSKCKSSGINTCIDTSGSILNDSVKELLEYTDRVLLDIKYSTEEMYQKYVGCSIETPLKFLEYLNDKKIPVTLRQVIIPTLNDNEDNMKYIAGLIEKYPCIDKTELLPFKKLCKVKYDKLGMEFAFETFDEPTLDIMQRLEKMLNN